VPRREGGRVSQDSYGAGAQLDALLRELLRRIPELEAAAVVTTDGLPMASALPAGMDEDRVAAMSAALLSLGERAAEGLGRGELSQVHIQGEHGGVWLLAAGDDAVLVGVSVPDAKAGLVLYELRRATAAVSTVLAAEELAELAALAERAAQSYPAQSHPAQSDPAPSYAADPAPAGAIPPPAWGLPTATSAPGASSTFSTSATPPASGTGWA
jgi:uncharacterized protein